VSGAAGNLASGVSYYGNQAASLTKSTVNTGLASAQDGTLMSKTADTTKKAASKATEMLGSMGYSLFQRVKDYSGTEVQSNPVVEQTQPAGPGISA
jgi:hypothetical protein